MLLESLLVSSGISSALASPRTTLRARLFKRISCRCRKKCCWRASFRRTRGPSQPQRHLGDPKYSARIPALGRILSQDSRMASFRGVVGRASEFSIILLLESADTSARKITLCVLESGRSLPAPFPLYSLRIRRRWSSTSNSHQCRQVELGVVRSERFCLLAKVGPYSVHALHQVGAREAQVKSDGGVIPAVYHPPLQQNPVRLCQISEQRATSAALHVLRIPLNPVSMLHVDQDLATRPAGMGGPTGFSSHGRQTPRRVQGAG